MWPNRMSPLLAALTVTMATIAVAAQSAANTVAQPEPSTGESEESSGAQTPSLPNRYVPYPAPERLERGMSWPEGQALPRFATVADSLDAIEVQALTPDEQLMLSALQGQVNKTQPRIYLLDANADEGRDTWAKTETTDLPQRKMYDRETKYELVAKYAGEVQGVVLFDPERSPHYRNLAGTVAGLHQALPVTAEVLERMRENGIDLEVLVDLTELPFTTPIEIYEHMYDRYWERCTKRLIISARPDRRGGDHHHTRDIAAACGAAIIWLDGRIPEERDLMRKFFGDMTAGDAVVLGWYTTERSGITTASEFGIGTLPADHYISGTVYAAGDPRIQIPPVPKKPTLENKAYVAIFISDGDNIQYTQRAMRRIWDQSADTRGRVPLSWTIAPGLVDIGPGILNYYYTTATPEDCFVTGPSGMGYMMPFNTLTEPGAPVGNYLEDPDRMEGYARLTETYLKRSGLRVVTIWDNATPMQRAAYEQHCRNLYGATVQNFRDVPSVSSSVEGDRVRFEKLVIPYTGTYEHLSGSLNDHLESWEGTEPLFLAYQVDIWGELKPERIAGLATELNERFGDRVRFVRADHYFNLYNEAHALPFNLMMSPTAAITTPGGEDASRIADGTPATVWTSGEGTPGEITIDLGQPYTLTRYVIHHAGASGMDRSLNTRAFDFEVSADGSEWHPVDTQRGNSVSVTDVDLEAVSARWVRIRVVDPGADGTARIADVEIYGALAEGSDAESLSENRR